MYQNDVVQETIFKLISEYSEAPDQEKPQRWSEFRQFVYDLAGRGLSRGEIYDAVMKCLRARENELSQIANDALSDFLGALAGHCDPEYAVRLPNDPCPPERFLDYVRSLVWMTSAQ